MATVKLEIISPDKMVFASDIEMLIVRSADGDLGILPGHAPLMAGLLPNALRVRIAGEDKLIAVAGGFMEVKPDKIIILASAAELPINIDINRAKQAYKRAQERLAEFDKHPELETIDRSRACAALQRAMARLQATKTDIG